MGKRDFKEQICRPFCKYFRDGQKEDMTCKGADTVERLLALFPGMTAALPRTGKDPSLWQQQDDALYSYVCSRCPFLPDGCDFRSPSPPATCEPCGGYILLSLLKRRGTVTERHLAEAAGEQR